MTSRTVFQKLYLIYVPGLGDNYSKQQKVVALWRWWGVGAELFLVNWSDAETWQSKLSRLQKRIDDLAAQGQKVGLVGASAGASAVINAYAADKDKVVGCVLIAGKINRPEAISKHYRQENPAFVESAYSCVHALSSLSSIDRQRILSRYALIDPIVSKADSFIPGARNQTVLTIGHTMTIATQTTLKAPSFISFLKRLD